MGVFAGGVGGECMGGECLFAGSGRESVFAGSGVDRVWVESVC